MTQLNQLPLAYLYFIIFGISIVQSLFGIGVLTLGTPLLMAFGLPLPLILFILLPCSMIINFFQMKDAKKVDKVFVKNIFLYCLPFMAISLSLAIGFNQQIDLKLFIGPLLVLSAFLRVRQKAHDLLFQFLKKHISFAFVTLGIIHGPSNMGGSLLTLIVATLFKDKKDYQGHIGLAYFMMAFIQLLVAFIFSFEYFQNYFLILPIVSAMTYYFVKRFLDHKINPKIFHHLLTLIIFLLGFTLIVKALWN